MTIFERISELLADTPRPCLYELGACDGNETVTFSKMFPTSTIVVVEPVPDLCKIISNRHELKGRIDLVKKAIGAENGKTTLHISGGNCEVTGQNFYASSSIKTPKFAEQVFKGIERVIKYVSPNKLTCYVLVGFEQPEIIESDIYRVMKLHRYKITPFAMGYIDFNNPLQQRSESVRHFQRWVNKNIFKKVPFSEYSTNIRKHQIATTRKNELASQH